MFFIFTSKTKSHGGVLCETTETTSVAGLRSHVEQAMSKDLVGTTGQRKNILLTYRRHTYRRDVRVQ